ncbi:hypothetical protein D9V87_03810 [Bacteroidetes/Chlorobi group bacterium MS-B_bin-24]|jgi:hypothetical protein|nr:MAG: hypothetical protein D9V87_03810 [Bacteroidetes/Chlorobi group bacterium MS-B_bin-24]
MKQKEIEKIYEMIKGYFEKYLQKEGVQLPKLNNKGKFSKEALVLVYLAQHYPNTKVVTKQELTEFIRKFYPNTNDVQQARHLAAQKGWYIASGTRGNGILELNQGEYKLITLEKAYPNFVRAKREASNIPWEEIKKKYDYRCATCGSKENEKHLHWKSAITQLQKAHLDPRKPITTDNIIPQCQFCNRAYRNFWIFDNKGRVRNIANPRIVLKADIEIQKAIYELLEKKFGNLSVKDE